MELNTSQDHSAFYLMSTIWDQNCYYNNYCPEIPDGLIDDLFDWLGGSDICDRALTGCVATALGQIAKYWNYPNTGSYSIGYNDDNLGYVGADFSSGYYDWSNMPNELSFWGSTGTQDDAVAKLLYHLGVASHMNYGEDGSGTSSVSALYAMSTFMNYSQSIDIQVKSEYTSNSSWEDLIKSQLDVGYLFIIEGLNLQVLWDTHMLSMDTARLIYSIIILGGVVQIMDIIICHNGILKIKPL